MKDVVEVLADVVDVAADVTDVADLADLAPGRKKRRGCLILFLVLLAATVLSYLLLS